MYRLRHHMHLFPLSRPLEFVLMYKVRPISKTVQGNQCIIVITDLYSKATRAVSTLKTRATHVVNLFVDHWFIPYGIPTYLQTNNGPQFVSMFFTTVCALLEVKNLTPTAYLSQLNVQTGQFKKKSSLSAFDTMSRSTKRIGTLSSNR